MQAHQIQTAIHSIIQPSKRHARRLVSSRVHHRSSESGQTTAEYALVLLAAGTIAMLVITWARGENSIDELFDLVLTKITTLIE